MEDLGSSFGVLELGAYIYICVEIYIYTYVYKQMCIYIYVEGLWGYYMDYILMMRVQGPFSNNGESYGKEHRKNNGNFYSSGLGLFPNKREQHENENGKRFKYCLGLRIKGSGFRRRAYEGFRSDKGLGSGLKATYLRSPTCSRHRDRSLEIRAPS